jgi:hypothetical protein
VINFRTARLRSNPRFRLLPFDECDERERRSFGHLAEDANFYGLLVPPTNSAAPIKSVSRDAALLFLSLREPACAPHLLTSLFPTATEDRVRELVLDGVCEIEHGGVFVSGSAALSVLGDDIRDGPVSRVARLAAEGIGYIAALEGLSASEAAVRLYMYNRLPCTALLQKKFADDDAIIRYLAGDTGIAKTLEKHWVREVSQDAWLVWRRAKPSSSLSFKLFISPSLDGLPAAFQVAVDALLRVKCCHFKVGRTAFGLLRPDKFVAYFASLEQVKEAAELIRASTAGISAQGVPFTGAIDSEGLVSWGMDPPRFAQVMGCQEHQSWRQWVTERVAVYTLAAKESQAENILDFVLQRIRLDGVDPGTWSPSINIWSGTAGMEEEVA